MDDLRVEWIRDQVFLALDLHRPEVFIEFLDRDEQIVESQLAEYLNETPKDGKTSLIFYKISRIEDQVIEIENGKITVLNIRILLKLSCQIFILFCSS